MVILILVNLTNNGSYKRTSKIVKAATTTEAKTAVVKAKTVVVKANIGKVMDMGCSVREQFPVDQTVFNRGEEADLQIF